MLSRVSGWCTIDNIYKFGFDFYRDLNNRPVLFQSLEDFDVAFTVHMGKFHTDRDRIISPCWNGCGPDETTFCPCDSWTHLRFDLILTLIFAPSSRVCLSPCFIIINFRKRSLYSRLVHVHLSLFSSKSLMACGGNEFLFFDCPFNERLV